MPSSRASHHMNFWIGATSLGKSGCPTAGGPPNEMRFGSQSDAGRFPVARSRNPGARRIAKPRKSLRLSPSGQSKARRTSDGERYALAVVAVIAMTPSREWTHTTPPHRRAAAFFGPCLDPRRYAGIAACLRQGQRQIPTLVRSGQRRIGRRDAWGLRCVEEGRNGRGTHRLPRQAQKLPPIVIPGQMRNPPPLPAVAWLKVKSGLAKKPPSD